MRRRDFIVALGGGATAAWPLPVRAQPAGPMRRLGLLLGYPEGDPEGPARLSAFQHGLADLGWIAGRNLRIDSRYAGAEPERMRVHAAELVTLAPEIIVVHTTPGTAAVLAHTQTIPVVFVLASDPIGSGFVKSFAQPGGHVTGFVNLEASMVEKWVELLKEVAPGIKRVTVLYNPETASYVQYYLGPFEAAARKLSVEPLTALAHEPSDIERIISGLGPESGLVLMTDIFNNVHRDLIIALSARYRVPAIHAIRAAAAAGGLISYGIDQLDLFRRSATYVDRILKGAKPADLPVQGPAKFELAINLKTAKELGLTISLTMQARADEVIE
jgi:putative ABC transport system substrate-binding protein